MRDLPLLIACLTVSAYWLRVGAMAHRASRKHGARVGVVPERASERAMWLVLVPIVVAWCILPWIAFTRTQGAFAVPAFAREGPVYPALRWAAALAGIACFVMSLHCWRTMGRHWRMDISDRNTTLLTDGPFARIRHPIYAYQIALMAATMIVLPAVPMLLVSLVHICAMNLKARNEEAHLARMHGETYRRYVERTGRFVPRAAARQP
jgi:protein-S-isoprenylcysteine O-methyltransferase Ste14